MWDIESLSQICLRSFKVKSDARSIQRQLHLKRGLIPDVHRFCNTEVCYDYFDRLAEGSSVGACRLDRPAILALGCLDSSVRRIAHEESKVGRRDRNVVLIN